jgi:dsDNA-specific endonuclease/ATPase MutS2
MIDDVMRLREWIKRWKAEASRSGGDDVPQSIDELEDESEVDPFNPFPEPIRLEISDVFDLHTISPRDVKMVVEEYLMEARSAGYRSVRIIHGKGKGVQRKMVHSILARTPFVEDWTDAPPEAGGLGATIVRFSPEAE